MPFYGVYDLAGLTGEKGADRDARPLPRPAGVQEGPARPTSTTSCKASPLAHVSPDAPDFFVLHGANDWLVDVRQARAFVDDAEGASRSDR